MKRIQINRNIFSDDTIIKALSAYKDYAATTVKMKEQYATVTFWKCKYDEELTIKEFENYLIGIECS